MCFHINTKIVDSKFIGWATRTSQIGDFLLTPSRFLLGGHTVSVVRGGSELNIQKSKEFSSNKRMLYVIAAILLFAPSLIIGGTFKSISMMSSGIRERNRKISIAMEKADDNPHYIDPKEFWQNLELESKVRLIEGLGIVNADQSEDEEIFEGSEELSEENQSLTIPVKMHDSSEVSLQCDLVGTGTGSIGIFRVRVVNSDIKFALKICKSNYKEHLRSIDAVIGHSIQGFLPIYSVDYIDIKEMKIPVIAMKLLEEDLSIKENFKPNPDQSSADRAVNYIDRLGKALIEYRNLGYTHSNIAGCNVMFDDNEEIYLVDIDNSKPIEGQSKDTKYSLYSDVKSLNEIFMLILNKLRVDVEDPIYQFSLKWKPDFDNSNPFIEDYLNQLHDVR